VNQKILNKAIELSTVINNKKQNICAIIVDKKDRILSIGFNSYKKSSTFQKKYADRVGKFYSIFNHAEIDAIKKINGGIPYSIYIARTNKKGESCLSSPCPICSLAIQEAGIKNIYYTR
jgi:tRNA(Arg) A34 adenosine deaminase TadA